MPARHRNMAKKAAPGFPGASALYLPQSVVARVMGHTAYGVSVPPEIRSGFPRRNFETAHYARCYNGCGATLWTL